ncbi:MAG TPA: ABC transporter permease [Gemmataceae bacterium]|nr:ABC transporter permease [Gemmataceae bacterium]
MWLLAIKSLLADRPKLLASLLGVAFSIVLVNLQGGLLLGLIRKASLLVDYGQADIWVGHRHMNNVDIGTFIPERWLQRIRHVDGVEKAEPYIVMFGQATMPDGHFENVVVVGSDAATLLGNAWVMDHGDPKAVRQPDGVLVDACDVAKLGNCKIGDVREINGHRAKIVGLTHGIVGFTTDPYVFTTLERARAKYTVGVPPGCCSYFLVKAKPGVDIQSLRARIQERVPELDVYDRRTYSAMCMEYWLTRTGIGLSFGLAALLGLLVGLAIVAQTLYASVTERIKEFGTLKAMGADDRCVSRFLVAQALGSAGLGSLVGLAAAVGLGHLLSTPRAPVELTWWIAAGSVVVITLICLLAAWLPYWRVRRIDPASVLRS